MVKLQLPLVCELTTIQQKFYINILTYLFLLTPQSPKLQQDCYNLKVIQKQKEDPDPNINDTKLKTHQLILKLKIPDGLNISRAIL